MVSPSLRGPAQVCWLFADADRSVARELLDLAAVLEFQGIIKNWTPDDIASGQPFLEVTTEKIESADIVMVLLPGFPLSLETARSATRLVPVLVRPTTLPPEWPSVQALPRDGQPLLGRRDRREGLLDVIQGLQEMVEFAPRRTRDMDAVATPSPAPSHLSINDIFRLDGPPTVNFVEPPSFSELKLELRTMGTGLIVEGPSKVGKSTAIKKALGELGIAEADQIWWHGQEPPPLDQFEQTLTALRRTTRNTWLIIDDFHYLEDDRYRRALAIAMKLLADQATRHAKVTLIGINPLGSSLVQVMPDLAGRFRIHRLDVEKDWKGSTKIAEVIILGERAANVRFRRRDEFVVAAGGSFFLAQWLCNRAAVRAGIYEQQRQVVEIDVGPADVITAIQDELAARFRAPMLEFAAFDVTPPPRGAGLSLLWLLTRSADGFVPVKEARLRFPTLEPAFDWFLLSNLSRCFQEHPLLKGLLYYNRATATLTMEDPQLKFFLRELDWAAFAEASGHGHVPFHPEDGPLWPITGAANITLADVVVTAEAVISTVGTVVRRPTRLLHLSDLHFSTQDQATIFYAQLAADLREQGVNTLDVLVVSGDLGNRADPKEYDAARQFLERLISGFGLSARQVVLVPGNHDVSWPLAEAAYVLRKRSQVRGPVIPGTFVEHGADVLEVRDDDLYRQRFQPFADLYRQIKGSEYPLDYADQGTLDDPAGTDLLILGLNSAWEIDHHYRDRASIDSESLARALLKLPTTIPQHQLRIAVFHHPIHSSEDSRLRDPAFLQQLAVHGFRLVLHGHVHSADAELYQYDRTEGGRRIDIVAAGTFGAPTREWVAGIPLQYNLLLIGPEQVTVETRCREKVDGAWRPDARWPQGPGKDPAPRYVLKR